MKWMNLTKKRLDELKDKKLTSGIAFGTLTVLISVLLTMLTLALVLPSYKNQLLKSEVSNVSSYMEEEMQTMISNYFADADMSEYLSEETIEKFSQVMITELQEKGFESSDSIKETLVFEVEKIVEEGDAAVKEEVLDKTKEDDKKNLETFEMFVTDNIAPQIGGNSSTISGIAGDVNNVKTEINVMETQITELQGNVGNALVEYNAEDGHFYVVYNKDQEDEVSKKLGSTE